MHRVAIPIAGLLLLGLALPGFAQDPTKDVPFDHWAYDAVQELVDEGVIIGYPDGTFKGDRAMTRYEFAMATARVLEKIPSEEELRGPPGDKGPRGDKGDRGPKGDKGPPGEGMTEDQIRATVNRMLDEFRDDLAALQDELGEVQDGITDLDARVTALENAKVLNPIGILNYRMGLAGDRFFSRRPALYPGGTPPRPGESDLFASEFDTLTAVIGVEGDITDEVRGRITWKMHDGTGALGLLEVRGIDEDYWLDEAWISFDTDWLHPTHWSVGRQFQDYGLGLLVNNERLSQQGVRAQASYGDLDMDWFLGMATYDGVFATGEIFGTGFPTAGGGARYAQDLFPPRLMDSWVPLMGSPFTGNFVYGPVGSSFFASTFPTAFEPGAYNDGYASVNMTYNVNDEWSVGGSYLFTGLGEETGWSANVRGEIWNRQISAEYAVMMEDAFGNFPLLRLPPYLPPGFQRPSPMFGTARRNPSAILVNAELYDGDNWNVRAYYSDADYGYNPYFSSLHPYYELLESRLTNTGYAWERWLDNPVVAHNLQAVGAYVDIQCGDVPIQLQYHNLLDRHTPHLLPDSPGFFLNPLASQPAWAFPFSSYRLDSSVAYDQLWAARATKEVAKGVNVTFTYAHQDYNSVYSTFFGAPPPGLPPGVGRVGLTQDLGGGRTIGMIAPDPFTGSPIAISAPGIPAAFWGPETGLQPLPLPDLDLLQAAVEIAF